MLNNYIVSSFIKSLNKEKAIKHTQKFNIYFTDEEIDIFLPYIQRKVDYLLKNQPLGIKIYNDLKDKINIESINKLIEFFKKLGYQ